MAGTTYSLEDIETRITAGDAFTQQDAERVLAATDLVSVGVLGESARRRRAGDRVTFGRVAVVTSGRTADVGRAGEVRLVGVPGSLDEGVAWVRQAASLAAGVPLTGFSLPDVMAWAGQSGGSLTQVAAALREAGLEAIAEVPIDRFASVPALTAAVMALGEAGLQTWRVTVDRAPLADRLALITRVAALQAQTGAVRAFAPLPRLDPADVPSTGYDDVRTIALAALVCGEVPFIQVDWPLYGPKLAQVAIAFGANDIDGVAAEESLADGPRRAPAEDIARQIRAASGQPAERNGRYEMRS